MVMVGQEKLPTKTIKLQFNAIMYGMLARKSHQDGPQKSL